MVIKMHNAMTNNIKPQNVNHRPKHWHDVFDFRWSNQFGSQERMQFHRCFWLATILGKLDRHVPPADLAQRLDLRMIKIFKN